MGGSKLCARGFLPNAVDINGGHLVRYFNDTDDTGRHLVSVLIANSGRTMKRALAELERASAGTLPTPGFIDKLARLTTGDREATWLPTGIDGNEFVLYDLTTGKLVCAKLDFFERARRGHVALAWMETVLELEVEVERVV